MPKLYPLIIVLSVSLFIASCNKKHHPGKTPGNNTSMVSSDSLTSKKIIKPKRKEATPKVIIVNDAVARKSVDGRLYYDLRGIGIGKIIKMESIIYLASLCTVTMPSNPGSYIFIEQYSNLVNSTSCFFGV